LRPYFIFAAITSYTSCKAFHELRLHSKENEKFVNNYQRINAQDMALEHCFIFSRLIPSPVLYSKMSEIAVYTLQLWGDRAG
jgi:hypothetical protein